MNDIVAKHKEIRGIGFNQNIKSFDNNTKNKYVNEN